MDSFRCLRLCIHQLTYCQLRVRAVGWNPQALYLKPLGIDGKSVKSVRATLTCQTCS